MSIKLLQRRRTVRSGFMSARIAVKAVVSFGLLLVGTGCCLVSNVVHVNHELTKLRTNLSEVNLLLSADSGGAGTRPPSSDCMGHGNRSGLIRNLEAVSGAVTNVTATLVPMDSVLHQVSVSLTNVKAPVEALGGQLGTLVGQIGGNNQDRNTNSPTKGLIGELASNTDAIKESTDALKNVERLKTYLPLLAGMATLVATLWAAVNIGNTARKNAWDKLKEIKAESIKKQDAFRETWNLYEKKERNLSPEQERNLLLLESAVGSIRDFRDAYAYAAFQLAVATGVITLVFGEDLWKNLCSPDGWKVPLALISVLLLGAVSLRVLYKGDEHEVKLAFRTKWPIEKEPRWYWLCPVLRYWVSEDRQQQEIRLWKERWKI